MTKSKAISRALMGLTLALHLGVVGAVCMNPRTWVSGYKVPLAQEIREAEAVVIGRVVSEQPLQEDPADPVGVTSYNVSVRVLARLKGNVPDVLVIRNENTSSRYAMGLGEEHILFVSRFGADLRVDACGNSNLRAKAPQLARKIQRQLQERATHVHKQQDS